APTDPLPVPVRALRTRQIMKSVHLFLPFPLRHLDEVTNLEDHATNGGVVLLNDRALMLQPEGLQRRALIVRHAEAAAYLTDLELLSHCHLPAPPPTRPARSRAVRGWSGE